MTVSGDGLVDGEGFKYSKFATVSTVGEGQVENTFTYEPNEKTLLANYSITVVNGTIQIATEKTPIVVTANSNTKVYDGEELTDAGFTFTEGVIPENYELRAKVEGSQTNAGESENKVTSIQIFNDAGVDVTDNFTIGTPVAGKLTVTKRVITLVSESNSCTYDGKEHSWTTVTPKAGTSWVEGEGVTYKNHTTITDHQNQAIDNDFGYEANEGTNLDNYSITKELGKIQIDKIETAIIIMPASDTKAYDGSSLTNSNFTLKQGSLVDGDVLEVEMDGSVTDVGSVNNAVDTYKVMRGEVVATGNYNFDAPEIGTLTITARSVTLTSGSDS